MDESDIVSTFWNAKKILSYRLIVRYNFILSLRELLRMKMSIHKARKKVANEKWLQISQQICGIS